MVAIVVNKIESSDPRLGRHVEHDERAWNYQLMTKEAKPQGATTHWPSVAGPLNQGQLGSCTGNATAQWLNTVFANQVRSVANNNKFLTEDDAVKIYSLGTQLDSIPGQYPPTDTGSTGAGVARAGEHLGFFTSYAWVFSFSSFLAAVEKSPVLCGTVWTNQMFKPVNGLVTVGSLTDSNIAGGHEYLCSGVDFEAQLVEFRNSWGDEQDWPGCKSGGYFAMTFKDFQTLLDNQGDITIPVGVTTAPTPAPPAPPEPAPTPTPAPDDCCAKLEKIRAILDS